MVIENALTNDPDVLEAAAVSVQDDRYGEVVGAYIARRPGTRQTREQIRQSVRSQMNPQVSLEEPPLLLGDGGDAFGCLVLMHICS